MIVDMKKITLVCLESDRDTALNALRELGVLHLEPAASDGNSDGAAAVASELARTESAVAALNAVEGASGDTVQAEPAALAEPLIEHRTPALKMLGNGVCPQQAALAYRLLL